MTARQKSATPDGDKFGMARSTAMRRVVCHAFGAIDRLAVEVDSGYTPKSGQVAIEVKAAGVNFADVLFVEGTYQVQPPTPFTPGSEVAGTIAACGAGVTGWRIGDRVMALCGLGGFAEQVVVSARSLLRMPQSLTFGQAASFLQSYGTALFALTHRTAVAPGEAILVLGAGGGIGLASIDLAKSLGLHPIAAASSETKLAAAASAGSRALICYTQEDLKVRARELSGGGVDVVVDPIGGEISDQALRALRAEGRHLVIGFASGQVPVLPANQLLLKNRTVVGVDWGAWSLQHPRARRALLDDLVTMADSQLHPVEPRTYPLDRAAAALSELKSRRVCGKLALEP